MINLDGYLLKIVNEYLDYMSVTDLAKKMGVIRGVIYELKKNAYNYKIETALGWLLTFGKEVKIETCKQDIAIDSDILRARNDTKECIREVISKRFESFQGASTAMDEKPNYIWDALDRDRTTLDCLIHILRSLGEPVALYIDGKKVNFEIKVIK